MERRITSTRNVLVDKPRSSALRSELSSRAPAELLIRNILPGIKQFSGEKIQWYLASELRERTPPS